ncbi:AMP-binding protein, partial [Gordonia sp. (in: high G+C Gram-positive bacteria)]|uniref:AMP-binding protein n=1 Tax=Gordonia sp. (in: high G+C Gram-positive bacteria) TaxID=84139 RepID=UPI003F9B24E0
GPTHSAGGRQCVEVRADGAALGRAASDARGSVFSAVLSAGAIAVHAATGARQFSVATPVVDRTDSDAAVGYFGNLVRIPITVDPTATLSETVAMTTPPAYRALDFRDVDFDLVTAAQANRWNADRTPSLMIATRTNPGVVTRPTQMSVVSDPVFNGTSQFTLSITVDLGTADIPPVVEVDHLSSVVDSASARAIARLTADLLTDLALGSDRIVDDSVSAPLHPESRGAPAVALATTVVEMVRTQIHDRADCTALLYGTSPDGPPTTMTYCAVGASADALARRLIQAFEPQTRVAVLCGGVDRVIALLGIWRARMVAVPIDLAYPSGWISSVLDSSTTAGAVVDGDGIEMLGRLGSPIERLAARSDTMPTDRPLPLPHPESVAYIGTTSGSTGVPKTIAVSHRALATRIRWAQQAWPIDLGDVRLAKSSLNFVDGITEIADALCAGAALYVTDAHERTDPHALATVVDTTSCRHLMAVPTVWENLLNQSPSSVAVLERVVLTGSATHPDLITALSEKSADVRNSYGCAELAGDVIEAPAAAQSSGVIGRLDESVIRVLDGRLRPVRSGIVGTVYVTGPALAHGYPSDRGATATAFVADPDSPGARMFCTGDRARIDDEGTITLLGRADGGMKVNGVRVERGEVEAALTSLDGVRAAAAAIATAEAGADILVAMIVASSRLEPHTVVLAASRLLPPGVTLGAVHVVEELPTLPSGKVDYGTVRTATTAAGEQRVHASETHLLVADLAAAVLGRESVDVDADLFAMGANSMHLVELSRRARDSGIEFTAADVFEHRSIGALLDALDVDCPRIESTPAGTRVGTPESPVTSAVSLPPSSRWLTADMREAVSTVDLPGGLSGNEIRQRVTDLSAHFSALRRTVSVSRHGRPRIRLGDVSAVAVVEASHRADESSAPVLVVVDRDAGTLTVRASPLVLDHESTDLLASRLVSASGASVAAPATRTSADDAAPGDLDIRSHAWSADTDREFVTGVNRISRHIDDRERLAHALMESLEAVTTASPSIDVEWRPARGLGPLADLVPAEDRLVPLSTQYIRLEREWNSREGRRRLSTERPADVALVFADYWETDHRVVVAVADDGQVSAHTSSTDCPPKALARALAIWSEATNPHSL